MRNLTDTAQDLAAACEHPNSELKFLGVIVSQDRAKRLDALEEENSHLRQQLANLTADIERLQAENKELSEPDTLEGGTLDLLRKEPLRVITMKGSRSITCYGFVTPDGVVIATNLLDKTQAALQRYLADNARSPHTRG